MKKKFFSFILAICLVVSCAFAMTACVEDSPADDHTHTLTKVDAVAETCTTSGNTIYYKCDCGKYFSDEQAKTEIENDSWIIAKTGHAWGEGVVTTPATPSADGEITYTCHCGETKTEVLVYTSPATVTQEEWNKAFEDAMSKTVAKTIYLYENSTEPLVTILVKEDTYCFTNNGRDYELILLNSDGNYYFYEKSGGSWTKENNDETSYNDQLQYLWDNFFGYFKSGDFESATFNETDGTYTYFAVSSIMGATQELEYVATFMQGKLTKWTCSAFGRTLTFDFTEPTIEIPQV